MKVTFGAEYVSFPSTSLISDVVYLDTVHAAPSELCVIFPTVEQTCDNDAIPMFARELDIGLDLPPTSKRVMHHDRFEALRHTRLSLCLTPFMCVSELFSVELIVPLLAIEVIVSRDRYT